MEKTKRRRSAVFWLCIALVLCLISAIGASLVQSDFGKVDVQDLRIVVDDGYVINGQIYIPENASAENPVPLVIVSHGSFNNFEMQDLNMVELSRRGFAVISSDAYRHGSSSIEVLPGDEYANMWHLIDYATASYSFIDPEKIGVSGHSMGGMIASATVQHYFEQEARGLGENKVAAILDVGYDGQYVPYEFEGIDEPIADFNIDWGLIQGKYDEWFFQSPDVNNNPARFLESDNARTFINQTGAGLTSEDAVENGKIYRGNIGGEEHIRAIFQSAEIHPKNHFSKQSAAAAVTFFYESLGVPEGYSYIDPAQQIWPWKEFFNFLGLIGILLFLFPFASVVMHGIPYFSDLLAHGETPCAPALTTGRSKAVYWGTYLVCLVLPALLVMPVMYHLIGKESFVPSTVTSWFGEPNTNELASWTLIVAVVLLGVFLLSHFLFGKGQSTESWGIKMSAKNIWKSFVLALLTVGTAYVILFFVDLCFNTDFRIWMIAMRVFTVDKILFAVAYFPAFAAFYLVNSLLVNGGNRVQGMPDWLVTLISCISNILGISVLIFIQYYGIVVNGTFTFNSMRIVNLFPLIVLIPVATIITRRFFKETGHIYLGSFVISMMYTMMTVANTMVTATIL
ncbi:MAG: alpha/beta hydrolase [Ruthenibacterium sp.]